MIGQAIADGVATGTIYAMFATAIVLVYRISGVLNLAQAAVAGLSGTILGLFMVNGQLPYLVAGGVLVALSAGLFAGIERTVIRRLSSGPALPATVATLGVGQIVLLIANVLPDPEVRLSYPALIGRAFTAGPITIPGPNLLAVAALVPLLITVHRLTTSPTFGVTMAAVGSNPTAAELAGIDAGRVKAKVWAAAGAITGLATLMAGPVYHMDPARSSRSFGIELLYLAAVAAAVGRFCDLRITVVSAIGLGIIKQVMATNADLADASPLSGSGTADVVILAALVLVLALRPPKAHAGYPMGTPGRGPFDRHRHQSPLAESPPLVRRLIATLTALVVTVLVFLPVLGVSHVTLVTLAMSFLITVVVISLVPPTGWGGTLSLGQFGFVAIGALGAGVLTRHEPLWVALAAMAGIGMAVGAGLGLLSLRATATEVTIVTLGFHQTVGTTLVGLPQLADPLREGAHLSSAELLGYDLSLDKQAFYLASLAGLVTAITVIMALRRSSLAQRLLAATDNAEAAALIGQSSRREQVGAWTLAGGLATSAGVLLPIGFGTLSPAAFDLGASLFAASIGAMGGFWSAQGVVAASTISVTVPNVFAQADDLAILAGSAGSLIVILYAPRGLGRSAALLRRSLTGVLIDLGLVEVDWDTPPDLDHHSARLTSPRLGSGPRPPAIAFEQVTVERGGLTVIDHLNLRVDAGRSLAVVGPNGSGKTTLLEAARGMVDHAGTITLDGRPLNGLSTRARADRGLGCGLQSPTWFPSLSIVETLALAHRRCSFGTDDTDELLARFGLWDRRHHSWAELSLGQRRVAELAVALSRHPSVLALDEPSSGLAQPEVTALLELWHDRQVGRGMAFEGVGILVTTHDWSIAAGTDEIHPLPSLRP